MADSTAVLSLFFSDYKGWSCLHHAATGGYTQTMETILGSHIKLLDKTNDDGVLFFFFCGFQNVFKMLVSSKIAPTLYVASQIHTENGL